MPCAGKAQRGLSKQSVKDKWDPEKPRVRVDHKRAMSQRVEWLPFKNTERSRVMSFWEKQKVDSSQQPRLKP